MLCWFSIGVQMYFSGVQMMVCGPRCTSEFVSGRGFGVLELGKFGGLQHLGSFQCDCGERNPVFMQFGRRLHSEKPYLETSQRPPSSYLFFESMNMNTPETKLHQRDV